MVGNKKRLYVALYPSGVTGNEERKYHWAFLVGPKVERENEASGTRYHVKNDPTMGWEYQAHEIPDVRITTTLLARFLIAKIENEERLIDIIRSIPVIQNDPTWRCRTWLANVLAAIVQDGKAVGTSELNWPKIEATARHYVAQKAAAGRYQSAAELTGPRPTWDMLANKETMS
ncbi:hypothetical protein BJY04DRAFT_62723 [Aspergillus karnatakaensis]|uniref:uncharacterized protein n=1 Tax=Aspergillus karnatakaensis TaxID=1810916 RepID=UPI003CCCE0DD